MITDSHKKNHESPLVKRVDEIFMHYYLTLIAIIEGVAFIMTIDHLFGEVKPPFEMTEKTLSIFSYALCNLILIIAMTFQYAIFLVLFRWKIRIWDTVFPYLIGFVQSAMPFFYDSPKHWWLMMLLFSIISTVTMISNRIMVRQAFEAKSDITLMKKDMNDLIRVISGSSFYSGAVALLIHLNVIPPEKAYIFLAVPIIMSIVYIRMSRTKFRTFIELKS